MSEMIRDAVHIVLTDRHAMSFDTRQFKLYTKSEPKDFDGDWSKVDYTRDNTWHPTIENVIRNIDVDECKEVLKAYHDMKDFGEKFDEMIRNPRHERLDVATRWFESFTLLDEVDSELKKVKAELTKAKAELRRLNGLGDEADANADVDPSKTMENSDMSIR